MNHLPRILLLTALVLTACSPAEETYFPDESWRTTDPEKVGIRRRDLLNALSYLKSQCFEDGVEEVLIVKDGYVVYQGDSVGKQHWIWSCTKTFTGTALGLLVAEGKCSIKDKAADYLPLLRGDYSGVELRHFVTMTSGYNAVGNSRWDSTSTDWSLTPFIPAPPLAGPGSAYAYWDEAQMMFGAVLTRIAGMDLKQYLDDRVMQHIGIHDWKWHAEPLDDLYTYRNGCTGIELSALQLARFGYLFLNEGRWKGRELVPREWVSEATQNQVPLSVRLADTDRRNVDGRGNYGFNWWTNGVNVAGQTVMPDLPMNTAYMSGLNNNVCFVIPEWNMVFIRMGMDGNPVQGKPFVYNEFFKRLFPDSAK